MKSEGREQTPPHLPSPYSLPKFLTSRWVYISMKIEKFLWILILFGNS